MFKKVLIANRGEIALRIVRACQELGIATVAVYSDVDRMGLAVQAADEAVRIGSPEPLASYLNIDKIISVARERHCDAIHPGYGFLAENHRFARRCETEGITFIGPNSQAMELVGDKLRSRELAMQAGVPTIIGMTSAAQDTGQLHTIAGEIGYPVMIKASAGGGGKGMRIVRQPEDLQAAIESGRREAKSAFGDETVYLEKYIENPRHIEFQVLADNFGHCVHLFERECSVQRRHQKIIEESPSLALDPALRQQMGEAAQKVITSAGYNNAGTVEFLLDARQNFYFLEVNARIQVEHPVTEWVTGIDLVKQQIHLAHGEALAITQAQLNQRGHAIECRIYAEDPENNFYPSFGKLHLVHEPVGPGIRCDSGIFTGWEVPYHYDPILAKLIVWDENRVSAIQRMQQALAQYVILGVKTQIPFLIDLLNHPEFRAGRLHTNFIAEFFADWKRPLASQHLDIALLTAALAQNQTIRTKPAMTRLRTQTPWQTLGSWEAMATAQD